MVGAELVLIPDFSYTFWMLFIVMLMFIGIYFAFQSFSVAVIPVVGFIIFMTIEGYMETWILYLMIVTVVSAFSYVWIVPMFVGGGSKNG